MANMITFLRIPLGIALLYVDPFSAAFWGIYLSGGLTDLADGPVARMLHQESAAGAKLDSCADLVFSVCAAIFVIVHIRLPVWLWLCISGIALVRFISYGVGCYKYHTFVSLHTYGNKVTGAFIFMAPIFYRLWGLTFTGVVLCITAACSSLEELVMTVTSKELNRDRKSMFIS